MYSLIKMKHASFIFLALCYVLCHPPLQEDIMSSGWCVSSYHTYHLSLPTYVYTGLDSTPPNYTPFTHLCLGSCVFPLSTPLQFLLAVLTSLSMMGVLAASLQLCLHAVHAAFLSGSHHNLSTSTSSFKSQ